MNRHYYANSISAFCTSAPDQILGAIARNNEFATELTQKDAWLQQIDILQEALQKFDGALFFEYAIPRMGKRIDTLLIQNENREIG